MLNDIILMTEKGGAERAGVLCVNYYNCTDQLMSVYVHVCVCEKVCL